MRLFFYISGMVSGRDGIDGKKMNAYNVMLILLSLQILYHYLLGIWLSQKKR